MKRWNFSNVMLIVGLLFIYLPMLILVIYSFNASKLVTVWGGWSVKWYVGLLDNTQLVSSVGRSLEIAFYTAFSSVLLGTLAAFVLTRIPRFRGRTLFGGMVTAPLVMPEVITGLSLLLLFVAMAQLIGWPQERGIVTIWIAHTSFCSSYVAVVVSARLRELDLSIEEAAMDLGAKPWKVFLLITIPMIAPSLAAGGMMSFALSLDDLVLASFVSGPGSTTLPMEVFSAVRLGVKPEINAVASLILLSVSLFTFFAWYFTRQAEERRRRAIQQAMEETATDWQKGSPSPPPKRKGHLRVAFFIGASVAGNAWLRSVGRRPRRYPPIARCIRRTTTMRLLARPHAGRLSASAPAPARPCCSPSPRFPRSAAAGSGPRCRPRPGRRSGRRRARRSARPG
ncbi:hypothetical protein PALA56_00302 [Pseudomonas aeruginosa]|nr:hypothetical protein PALA56_00302 [Pseudomonas aeruginosa]